MLDNSLVRRILHANTFILICVFFTIATLLDMGLSLAFFSETADTSYPHLATRFVICTFVAISLLVFRIKKLPFYAMLLVHFAALVLFAVLLVLGIGLFAEQDSRAMFYMVRSVIIVYAFVAVGLIIVDRCIAVFKKRKS